MQLICEKNKLVEALTNVQRAVSQRSTIAALEGILLKAEGNELTLCGYNTELGITTKIETSVQEEGAVVLNAHFLTDIVRKLSGDVVEITLQDNLVVRIVNGASKFELLGINAQEFPSLPSVENATSFTLPIAVLKSMIKQTIFAVSEMDAKPVHTGTLFEIKNKTLTLSVNQEIDRDEVLEKLVNMLYERNELDFKRGTFRARGDILEIIPNSEHRNGIRVEFFGDEIDKISEIDTLTGKIQKSIRNVTIFPASHFVTSEEKLKIAIEKIKEELQDRLKELKEQNKLLEAERLEQRTKYDIEMLSETGFCSGVENYSRHLAGREEGETPTTLIDFFGDDFLLVIDESHVTIPQVRAMYNGDRARKTTLVEYGFRLPSALDNRPLKFEEFENKLDQVIYVSATPGDYELALAENKVDQIIRPTGLLDPTIEIRKTKGQIDDLINEIRNRTKVNERVLITTLTIRMSEELTKYLKDLDIKVAYLHNEIQTILRRSEE